MNNNQVEVSLILCGYNAESTMEKSLDSAVAQTLDALEILCINDGSTDRTSEIFHSYAEKDSRIKVIDHPVNKGLLAARQTGVNTASGKYIMFLDLDDELKPEACLELDRKMNETRCDLIQFDTELVFTSEEDRRIQEKTISEYFSLKQTGMLHGSDNILKACFLDKKFPWNVWSKIYKTALARKVYSFVPEKMKVVMAEDTFAFFLAASMAKTLLFVNKKYYLYCVGVGVSGNTDLLKAESSMDVYFHLIKPYAEKYSSETGRQCAALIGKFFRHCMIYKLQSEDLIKSCREMVPREIGKIGLEEEALAIAENWDMLGFHPLKTAVLGIGSGSPSNQTGKIGQIGVIIPDAKISPSLNRLFGLLRNAHYKIRIFLKNAPDQRVENPFPDCPFEVYPDDRQNMISYFSEPAVQKQNDAFILLYDSRQDYDLTGFLLFLFRFAGKKPVFAFLEKKVSQLNCHDKIYLSAFDCVLNDSREIAPLFGDIGVFVPKKDSAGQLKKIVSLFESKSENNHCKVLSARKCMKTTGEAAAAALGYAGFGNPAALDREKLKQKIIAAKAPVSVDDYCLIRESGFFDDEYYRKQFPGCTIEDPILHFCSTGFPQLAAPSAVFDSKFYYLANQDLYPAMNPLLHYLQHGIFEHRNLCFPGYDRIRKSGYFDEDFYQREYKDELGCLDPLTHYLLVGWKKGCLPSELFVDRYYSACYVGFEQNIMNPLYHYVFWGRNEGRCAFPLKPRFESYFPKGFDEEAFWQCKDKYLILVHQLDFSGVPILGKSIAAIYAQEKCAGILSPMDGPLRKSCLDAGIPVLIDSDFFVHKERAAFYKNKGFRVCLFNTLGLVKPFLRTASMIPSILWIHDNLSGDFLPDIIRNSLELAPSVFATSEITLKYVRSYNPAVRYLPYPVKDFGGHHKNAVPDKIRFGVFGAYTDRKGQDIAIAAFKTLPAKLKAKADLLLIGNPVMPEYARKLETMTRGEDNIHFIPAEKDSAVYHQFYENLEVQICPSRTDPMPLVVFDGMMHGCPVILSDTVGQSEFIQNGVNGYVFQSGNETALRDCMVKILENPDHFIEMSQAIRQTFLDHFEFTKASGTIRRILDEVKNYL